MFGQAQDEDIIRRKILEKVATFTTWPTLSCLHHEETTDSADSDRLLVTTSDLDSSGDGTVTAQSVEGEDDLVDVFMQDTIQGDIASPQEAERYVNVAELPLDLGTNSDKDPQQSSRNSTAGAPSGSNLMYTSMDSSKICLT